MAKAAEPRSQKRMRMAAPIATPEMAHFSEPRLNVTSDGDDDDDEDNSNNNDNSDSGVGGVDPGHSCGGSRRRANDDIHHSSSTASTASSSSSTSVVAHAPEAPEPEFYHHEMSEPPVPELDNDMSTTDDVASSAYLASPSSVASGAQRDHIDPQLVPAEDHANHQYDAVSLYHSTVELRPVVFPSGDDESPSDGDDEDGESTINSTRSVNPLDIPYMVENERLYCGDYYMPIDELELDRLYLFHQVYLKMLDGQLTTATLEEPTHILDVGTASGDWAMAAAEQYQDCEVTGIDIADVFERRAPPNCFWEVDDAELEWERPANRYDLIHLRNMAGAFRDWSFIYESAYRCLKPGGWIEIMDFVDHTLPGGALTHFRPESQVHHFMASVDKAAELAGRPRGSAHLEPRMLFEAGYMDVRVTEHSIPLKLNDGSIGKTWLVAQLATLEALGLRLLTRHMHWSAEGVRAATAEVEKELLEFARAPGKTSAALRIRVLLGRKPEGNMRWSVDSRSEADEHTSETTTMTAPPPTTRTTTTSTTATTDVAMTATLANRPDSPVLQSIAE